MLHSGSAAAAALLPRYASASPVPALTVTRAPDSLRLCGELCHTDVTTRCLAVRCFKYCDTLQFNKEVLTCKNVGREALEKNVAASHAHAAKKHRNY
jgi:hypothetical protein